MGASTGAFQRMTTLKTCHQNSQPSGALSSVTVQPSWVETAELWRQ